MSKVVNIEEVRQLQAKLAEINAIPFSEIEWHEQGEPIPVTSQCAQDWRFLGMSNCAFVETEFWKQ